MENKVIDPEVFNLKLQKGEINANQVIDVRELGEWSYYHLDDSLHIPMNTIPDKIGNFDQKATFYVICAHGVRSAAVCKYMSSNNFLNVINVEGGMACIAELRGYRYE